MFIINIPNNAIPLRESRIRMRSDWATGPTGPFAGGRTDAMQVGFGGGAGTADSIYNIMFTHSESIGLQPANAGMDEPGPGCPKDGPAKRSMQRKTLPSIQ